jgi:uncharacterized Zn-finger protein
MSSTSSTAASSQTAQSIKPELVTTGTVSCDGGGGPLGHPNVYLTFTHSDEIVCPYCSRAFKLAPGTKLGHGH